MKYGESKQAGAESLYVTFGYYDTDGSATFIASNCKPGQEVWTTTCKFSPIGYYTTQSCEEVCKGKGAKCIMAEALGVKRGINSSDPDAFFDVNSYSLDCNMAEWDEFEIYENVDVDIDLVCLCCKL
jgi:hypothetical protein